MCVCLCGCLFVFGCVCWCVQTHPHRHTQTLTYSHCHCVIHTNGGIFTVIQCTHMLSCFQFHWYVCCFNSFVLKAVIQSWYIHMYVFRDLISNLSFGCFVFIDTLDSHKLFQHFNMPTYELNMLHM